MQEHVFDAEVIDVQDDQPDIPPIWLNDYYTIKQKVLTVGNKYYIEDGGGRPLGFCHMKLFKLKDDLRIYTDETRTEELLFIHQTQIFNDWAEFKVTDSTSGQLVGYIRRLWGPSLVQSEYTLHDGLHRPFGRIIEDSAGMGLLRRLVTVIPSKYFIELHGHRVAELTQKLQVIGDTWWLDARADHQRVLDRRLMVAGAILMDAIEQHEKRD